MLDSKCILLNRYCTWIGSDFTFFPSMALFSGLGVAIMAEAFISQTWEEHIHIYILESLPDSMVKDELRKTKLTPETR